MVFLEQNRKLEGAGWQVVPFAMRHPQNLPTPWAGYFPDEIEFGPSCPPQIKLLQARLRYCRPCAPPGLRWS